VGKHEAKKRMLGQLTLKAEEFVFVKIGAEASADWLKGKREIILGGLSGTHGKRVVADVEGKERG